MHTPVIEKFVYRKGVSALILNSKNEFLLINLESFAMHFFAVPGGGTEKKETLKEAVYREIKEELGIHQDLLEPVGKSSSPLLFLFKTKKLNREGIQYDGSERHFFGFKFLGNEEDIKLQVGEVRSYRWVTFAKLKNYLLFDNQLTDTIEKIREIFNWKY